MNNSRSTWGRGGSYKTSNALNISQNWTKNNSPESTLLFYERFLLCRLMVSGNPVKYQYFIDPRNKLIYESLAYLQIQEYKPGVDSLIRYLDEYSFLNQVGGETHVRDIFQGIPPGGSLL
jgi:hypothetical protein